MYKILIICVAVVTFASHAICVEHPRDLLDGFASVANFPNFSIRYATPDDKDAFEVLRASHNAQDTTFMPDISNIFDNQMARLAGGNAWSLVLLMQNDVLKAALAFGRLPTKVGKPEVDEAGEVKRDEAGEIQYTAGYHPEKHAGIIQFFQEQGIVDADSNRIGNHGLATYNIIADVAILGEAEITEIHAVGVGYATFLACKAADDTRCLLPVEKTIPYALALITRPDALDAHGMNAVNLTENRDEEPANPTSAFYQFYNKPSVVWTTGFHN